MAGITLSQAETQLALWLEAETSVATGQAYSIGGRSLTRVNANYIGERIKFWDSMVKRLSGGGVNVRNITPVI